MIDAIISNHHRFFPNWKSVITHENMVNDVIKSRPYVITPSYIKYWDDKLFGEEGTREYEFGQ